MGRLFFGSVSFIRIKEMNSPMKGETSVVAWQKNKKEMNSPIKDEKLRFIQAKE